MKDDSHMLFLTYEWMVANHREAIIKVATFLGKDCTPSLLAKKKNEHHFPSCKNTQCQTFQPEGSFTTKI